MKKLIVLDINGLIVDKVYTNSIEDSTKTTIDRVIKHGKHDIYIRKHAIRFIKTLLEKYDIGIWSSTTKYNAEFIINYLYRGKYKNEFKFIWYRDRTQLDPDFDKNDYTKSWDTVKTLSQVFLDPIVNSNRQYNESNTIILDDSATKTRFNNPKNVLLVKENIEDIMNLVEDIDSKFLYM